MINYTLPDFTVGLGLNLFFIRLLEQRPALFQDGVRSDSVDGCFPAFDGVEAIVYADLVGDYVRERYGMRCVLSTTRALADAAEVNRMTKRYDYVVLDYNRHKDPAFLAALEDRDKVEVMVNEFCAYRCPHRAQHYLHNSEDQRSGTMRPFECVAKRADFFDHEPGHPVIFTDREVRDLHDEYGIGYFKIVGRGVAFQTVLEAYAYYLVRPEYREDVKRMVMRAAG